MFGRYVGTGEVQPTLTQMGNCQLSFTHPSTMSSRKSSLSKEITDKLQDCLPEFTNGKKAKRKELLDKLAEDTVLEGSSVRRHRKVNASQCYIFSLYIIPYNTGDKTLVL